MQVVEESAGKVNGAGLTERQSAVLESALNLLVDGGESSGATCRSRR